MKVVASTVAPLPETIIKMEDRKRPAGQSVDDLAPPTKRQAVNGGSKVSVDADMPWKEDLEVSLIRSIILCLPCFSSPQCFVYVVSTHFDLLPGLWRAMSRHSGLVGEEQRRGIPDCTAYQIG
jgi:hypothetical protein